MKNYTSNMVSSLLRFRNGHGGLHSTTELVRSRLLKISSYATSKFSTMQMVRCNHCMMEINLPCRDYTVYQHSTVHNAIINYWLEVRCPECKKYIVCWTVRDTKRKIIENGGRSYVIHTQREDCFERGEFIEGYIQDFIEEMDEHPRLVEVLKGETT